MVRPSQERSTVALTTGQSDLAGDGTEDGENVDIDGGGTVAGGGSTPPTPPAAELLVVEDDSATWDGIIDASEATWWDITLTADTELFITNPPPANSVSQLHIILRQGTGAPWAVTWPAEVIWPDTDGTPGGTAPTLWTVETAGNVFHLTTEDGGTTWDGGLDPSTSTPTGDIDAADVSYDNTTSELDATNVQDALDELAEALGFSVMSVGSITAGGSPQTIINDTKWNEFPGAIRLDASRALVVYRGDGTDHITAGKICGQILTLGAAHDTITAIGPRFTILSDALDLRLEDGVAIIDDQIVVAFRKYTGTANTAPHIIICDDAPADFTASSTWGAAISIPLTTGSVQNYTQGYVHKLASGDFFVGAGIQSGGTHSVGIWKWTAAAGLADPSGGSFITIGSGVADYAEIALLETSAGNVLALLRSVTNTDIRKATSTDSGGTWSSVTTAYDGYGYPMFRVLLSGLLLTVYRDAPNGDTMWRTSTNLGTSWSSETLLDATGTRSAYATLLQTTPNDILCPYAVEYASDGSTGTADIFYQWFADSSVFGSGVLSDPTTTEGDLIYRHTGALDRLAVGSSTQVLHGGTDPNYAAVVEGDLGLTDITTANVSTTKHGFAPKLSNSATTYLDGTGAYSTPAGSSGGIGEILISDTPAGSPLVFADLLQNEAQDDLVYADP